MSNVSRGLDVRSFRTNEQGVRTLASVFVVACLFYGGTLLLFATRAVDPLVLLQDPGDDANRALHVGLLSNLGVFAWIATTAVLFFASIVGRAKSDRATFGLLISGATLSLLLAVDDFFLLHDRVIPQVVAYGTYAVLGLSIVAFGRRRLLQLRGLGVVLAGALLAGSIVVDVLQNRLPLGYRATQVLEEGLKFTGIVLWLAAWTRVAQSSLDADRDRVTRLPSSSRAIAPAPRCPTGSRP